MCTLYVVCLRAGPLTIRRLSQLLSSAGMHAADPRLKQVYARLHANASDTLTMDNFLYVVESASLLIYRALTHKLVLPDWAAFTHELDDLYRASAACTVGNVADYIPALASADPNTWAMSFCSIDGQQHGSGDTCLPFSVQSTSKPLTYLMALEEMGEEQVHRFVGREPSGRNFNELCLNSQNIPHNPMVRQQTTSCAAATLTPSRGAQLSSVCLKRMTLIALVLCVCCAAVCVVLFRSTVAPL